MIELRKFIPRNWKVVFVGLLVNAITLAVVILFMPGIQLVNYHYGLLLFMAAGLGLLEVFVKPLLQLLTIRLLFVTYGIVLILVNAAILWLTSLIFKSLVIDGLLAALIGGIIVGLLGSFLDYVFGVTPPLGYVQALREEEAQHETA
ncbi:MAG TPA: phage holin family protein [Chloroflexota bacterium]|nr:phage holin family protein [Chloroflexota bacterium]